jgi:hypothetical protein
LWKSQQMNWDQSMKWAEFMTRRQQSKEDREKKRGGNLRFRTRGGSAPFGPPGKAHRPYPSAWTRPPFVGPATFGARLEERLTRAGKASPYGAAGNSAVR